MNNAKKYERDNRGEIEKLIQKAELQRKEFLKEFSLDKITSMKKECYVIGKKDKNTFCYFLEHRLNVYGELKGQANVSKFGVYFSDNQYKYTKKFGSSLDDAFSKLKKEICALIDAGQMENYKKIDESIFAPTVKNKILTVYYPEKYLSILSEEHINMFLYRLGLTEAATNKSGEEKKMLLLEYKNKNKIMRNWDNIIFVKYLYDTFFEGDVKENFFEAHLNFGIKYGYVYKDKIIKERKSNSKNISSVKKDCEGYCQICGRKIDEKYGDCVIEIHHIEYYSISQNDNLDNLIAVCPNHHRLIHKLNPKFDRKTMTFTYPNGYMEKIKRPLHLEQHK